MRDVKWFILKVCKALGLYTLTHRYFGHRLYILCYYGFQVHDERWFRPKLFISR